MKKLFYSFMTLALVFTLASCKKDKPTTDDPTDPTPADTVPTTPTDDFEGYTKLTDVAGVAYTAEGYIVALFTNDNPDSIQVLFNTEVGAETLPVGTYTVDEEGDYAAGTFDATYSVMVLADGTSEYVEDATIVVTKAGKKYTVKMDITDSEGEVRKFYYQGAFTPEVYSFNPQTSFDVTWNDLDEDWTYYFYSDQISMYVYTITLVDAETGWEFDASFTTNSTDTEGKLPAGTYNMLTTGYAEFGIVPGYNTGTQVGGTYITDWSTGVAYLTGGSLTVTVNGDNTTLAGTLTDGDGKEYSINVTGATPTISLYTGALGANGNKRETSKKFNARERSVLLSK